MRTRDWPAGALLGVAAASAGAQTLTFDNSCGNSFWAWVCGPSTNWTPESNPGPATDAVISGFAVQVNIQGALARSVTADSGLVIERGPSLSLTAPSSITRLTLGINSVLRTEAALAVDGESRGGGRIFGAGELTNRGTFTGALFVGDTGVGAFSVVNEGAWALPDATGLSLIAGSRFANTGALRLAGRAQVSGDADAELDNSGDVIRLPGPQPTHVTTIDAPYAQGGGTLQAAGPGSLWFRQGAEFRAGVITISDAGLILLRDGGQRGYVFDGLTRVSGNGTLRASAAYWLPMAVRQPLHVELTGDPGLHLAGSYFTIDSTLTNAGRALCSGSNLLGAGTLRNAESGVFTLNAPNAGAMDADIENAGQFVQFTGMTLQNATTFTNTGAGAVHTLHSGAIAGPGHYINDQGLLVKPDTPLAVDSAFTAPFDQRGGGTLRVEKAKVVLSGGGDWDRGTLKGTAAGQVLVAAGTFALTGPGSVMDTNIALGTQGTGVGPTIRVAAANGLTFDGRGILFAAGHMGGPGEIRSIAFDFEWRGGTVGIDNTATFINDGLLRITTGAATLNGTFRNDLLVDQTATMRVGNGMVENSRWWRLYDGAGLDSIGAGRFVNTGDFEYFDQARASPEAVVECPFDNAGLVRVESGRLRFAGPVAQVQNAMLMGGSWEVSRGAVLMLPGPFNTIAAGARVTGSHAGMPLLAGVRAIEAAELNANGPITFDGELKVRSGGRVVVGPDAVLTAPGGVENGGPGGSSVLDKFVTNTRGLGLGPAEPLVVTPLLRNHALLLPGDGGLPGPLNLTGDFEQTATGRLLIDLGGPAPAAEHDTVVIDGDAALDGRLEARLIAGFLPSVGQVFEVLRVTGAITGRFAAHELPLLPGGARLAVEADDRAVRLRVEPACYADCDTGTGPEVLDIFDFLCFQNAFAAGAPYACECDTLGGPGVCDIFDFLCFQNAFAAGCP